MDQKELWHIKQPYVAIRLKKGKDKESYLRPIRDNQVQIQNEKKTTFRFGILFLSSERVYEENEQTEQVFKESLLPILRRSIMGLNSLIICHGQSGSGKSYTMLGESQQIGLVQFTAEFLFDQVKQSKEAIQINIQCYEIYEETVFDLMSDFPHHELHQVLNIQIKSINHVKQIIKDARDKRHKRNTILNKDSSRGHVIFEFEMIKDQNSCQKLITKIALVDLAEDDILRQKESIIINQSLFALNNVIRQLGLNHKYINYRDSKLTYSLKHLLKSDTLLAFILLIKQDYCYKYFSETTLKFGQNVRQIQNSIIGDYQQRTKNEDYLIRQNEQLKKQIRGLQMQLLLQGSHNQTEENISLRQQMKIREKEQQYSRMEKNLQDANNKIQNLMNINKVSEAKIELLEGETKLGQQLQFSRQISQIESKLLREFKQYDQNNERDQQEEIEVVKNTYIQQNYTHFDLNEQFYWNFEIDDKEQFE